MRFYLRYSLCCLAIVLLGINIVFAQNQPQMPAPCEDALVLLNHVPVHTSPDATSPIATEAFRGMVSNVEAVQRDENDLNWYYLTANASGWIPAEVDGQPALARLEQGDIEQMITSASELLNADPTNVEAFMQRAFAYQSEKNFADAAADFTNAVELDTENPLLRELRGDAYLDLNDGENAQRDLEQAIALGRRYGSTYNRLAGAYSNQGEYGMAIDQYLLAIEIIPEYGVLYNNLANVFISAGLPDKAPENYELTLQYDPLYVNAYTNQGLHYERARDYDQAMEYYNMALNIYPCDYNTLVRRGYLYMNPYVETEASFNDLNQAITIDPDNAQAYMARGSVYYLTGDIETALDDYNYGLELDPNNQDGYYNLASIYGRSGNYEAALESYNMAIEVGDYYDYSALLYRAQIYVALGDDTSALADLNVYAQPDRPEDFVTVVHLVRASLYLRNQNYAEALADYRIAFDTWQEFAQQYHYYGLGYRTTPHREEMIPNLKNAVATEPTNANLLTKLGALYMEFGRWDEGLNTYRQYLELEPNTDLAYLVEYLESVAG
jgi:tetratricopeptide (TPR) repeat protein